MERVPPVRIFVKKVINVHAMVEKGTCKVAVVITDKFEKLLLRKDNYLSLDTYFIITEFSYMLLLFVSVDNFTAHFAFSGVTIAHHSVRGDIMRLNNHLAIWTKHWFHVFFVIAIVFFSIC